MDTEEFWQNIMLECDQKSLNTLINYLPVVKKHANLYFWTNKFKHDGLMIIGNPKTTEEWLVEYNKIINVKIMAPKDNNVLLSMILQQKYFYIYYDIKDISYFNNFVMAEKYYTVDDRTMDTIIKEEELIESIEIFYEHTRNNVDRLLVEHCYREDNHIYISSNATPINKHNLYDLLLKIYYYYPNQTCLINKLSKF